MDPTAPGGEQPQAPVVTPTPDAPTKKVEAPVPPTPTPPSNEKGGSAEEAIGELDVASMSDADLANLESGDPVRIAEALKLPNPKQAKVDAAAAAQTDVSSVTDEAEGPIRISLKGLSSKAERILMADAVASVRGGEFKTLKEALIAKLDIKPSAAAEASPAKTPEEAEPQPAPESSTLAALKQQVADKEAAIKTAKEEYRYDDAQDLMMELIDIKSDLKFEEREAARLAKEQTSEQTSFATGENESRQRVMGKYGEMLADPDSPFNDLLDVEITLAERKNDPILSKPDWPEKIADRTFEKHKATLGGKQADTVAPNADDEVIPPPPKREIRLPGSPVAGGANTSALTPTAAYAEMDQLSPDQQAALLEALEAKAKAHS